METRTVSPSAAIKEYFERVDAQAPQGGRKVTIQEQQELIKLTSQDDRRAFASACAEQLGATLA